MFEPVTAMPFEPVSDQAEFAGVLEHHSVPPQRIHQTSGGARQNAGAPQQRNYAQPSKPQKTGMAIASLVLGIVGCFLAAPVGLILGIVAVRKASRSPFEYGGKGLAVAGIVLNVLQLATLPILAAIAVPNFFAARISANEGSALSTVSKIAAAQTQHMAMADTKHCAELSALGQRQMIDPVSASGVKNGYLFTMVRMPEGCEIYATPQNAKGMAASGRRSFYVSTQEGVLRGAAKDGKMAGADDPELDSGGRSQVARQ